MNVEDVLEADWDAVPNLRDPVLVVALRGWFDAAGANERFAGPKTTLSSRSFQKVLAILSYCPASNLTQIGIFSLSVF